MFQKQQYQPDNSYQSQQTYNQASSQNQQELDNLELEHISGYSGQYFKSIHFHPQLKNLFIYSIGGLVVVEDINDKHQQQFLRGHDMPITALAISPSGRFVASGQLGTVNSKIPESPVILWDLANMKILNIFRGLRDGVTSLSFSPDDKFLAATSQNCVFMIWNCFDYSVIYNKVGEVSFSQICWNEVRQAGKYASYSIITAIGNLIMINELEFNLSSLQYHLTSSQCQLPSSGLQRKYTTSFIDNANQQFVVGTTGGEICIFNIPNKLFKAAIPISTNGVLSFAHIGNNIFTGSGDGKLRKLSGQGTKWVLETEVQLSGQIVSLSLNCDRTELIAGTSNGKIYRVLIDSLDAALHSESHTTGINDIEFPRDNSEIFATIDDSGLANLWDINELSIVTSCVPPSQNNYFQQVQGNCVTFTDDAGILVGYNDQFIRCFEMGRNKYAPLRWEIVNAHKDGVTTLYCDQNYIVSGGVDGIVRVWARKTRQLIKQIPAHSKYVVKVLPDIKSPNIIHSSSQDKTIYSYDLKIDKKLILHQAKNGVIYDMTQRKDLEQELITCGLNTPITSWDVDVIEPVDQIQYPAKLLTLQVSPSGQFLALGSEFGEIILFDIKYNKFLTKHMGHSAQVNKLKWSPDEKQLVSVSSDNSLCIWNFFQ